MWKVLPKECRNSLRQACPQIQRLTEQLITSATHDLSQEADSDADSDEEGSKKGSDHSDDDDQQEPRAGDAAWRRTARRQASFLARLTHLKALQVQHWPSEAHLTHALLRYGPSIQARLTSLTLNGGHLSVAGARAVRAACPNLQQLSIVSDRGATNNTAATSDLQLRGALFETLSDTPLTKVTLSACGVTDHVMMGLAALPHLRHLDFDDSYLSLPHIRLVSHLTNLSHLRLRFSDRVESLTLPGVAPLFHLTQLTHLCLPDVHSREEDDPTAPLAEADALALLGAMTNLRSLELHGQFKVGPDEFAALARLSRLTSLTVHSICLDQPAPGRLPLLQELHVWDELTPAELLATLLPLVPLPSLTGLFGVSDSSHLYLYIGAGPRAAADVQAAALRQLAAHLAAAPHLRLPEASLQCEQMYEGPWPGPRPLAALQIAEALRPLAGRLTALHLSGSTDLAAGWGALGACLPSLSTLLLSGCRLSVAMLAVLLVQLPSLQALRLHDCTSLGPRGWRDLVAACPCAVVLDVRPHDPSAPLDLGAPFMDAAQ